MASALTDIIGELKRKRERKRRRRIRKRAGRPRSVRSGKLQKRVIKKTIRTLNYTQWLDLLKRGREVTRMLTKKMFKLGRRTAKHIFQSNVIGNSESSSPREFIKYWDRRQFSQRNKERSKMSFPCFSRHLPHLQINQGFNKLRNLIPYWKILSQTKPK